MQLLWTHMRTQARAPQTAAQQSSLGCMQWAGRGQLPSKRHSLRERPEAGGTPGQHLKKVNDAKKAEGGLGLAARPRQRRSLQRHAQRALPRQPVAQLRATRAWVASQAAVTK